MPDLELKRSYVIPENEMVIIKDTNTLLHNIVDSELKEKNKEIERLTKRLEESQLAFLQVDKEKQRLNNIIKEVREYIKAEKVIKEGNTLEQITNYEKNILEILEGEDKE